MFSDSVLTVSKGEIFLERIFFKIGNSRRNIKLLVTGYVINYLTADCLMPNRKEGKWPGDFNACCAFLNRPKPLMGSDTSSVCNFYPRCPDFISQRNQRWRHEMSAVFSGYIFICPVYFLKRGLH